MADEGESEDETSVAPDEPSSASADKRIASPHDTYVYKVLGDPTLAAAEFKHVLPAELAAEIEWDKLEQDTNRFADENLDNHYTDLLFRTTLRGTPIKLRLLLEHSSYDKPFELLQVLRYQLQEWERESQQKPQQRRAPNQPRRLTPIITVILHHSETGWRGRTSFMDYFGFDERLALLLRPFVVDFGIVLNDISKENAEAFMQRPVPPEVQLLLFALRYARTGPKFLDELPHIVLVIVELLQQVNGRVAIKTFLKYVERVANVSEAEVQTKLQERIKERINARLDPEMVAVFELYDAVKEATREGKRAGLKEGILEGIRKGIQEGKIEGIQEGKREGILEGKREGILEGKREGILEGKREGILEGKREGKLEGKREGKLEGKRAVLQRLLTQRFGTLNQDARAKLKAATSTQLDAMTLRVLTATSLEEVLA